MAARLQDFDQPGALMERTRTALIERGPFRAHEETRIPFYWLRTFAAGGFKNPSVNRVQYLYEHDADVP